MSAPFATREPAAPAFAEAGGYVSARGSAHGADAAAQVAGLGARADAGVNAGVEVGGVTTGFQALQQRGPGAGVAHQVVAALLWIVQAGLLAWAAQGWAEGQGSVAQTAPLALGVLLLGFLRAWLDGQGTLRAHLAARAQLSALREQVVLALGRSSPLDKSRAPSGQAASAVVEQAEAIVPWLARYQTAMWRVRLVPLALLLVVASQSWVAALILLVAAPLIPLFMALVGWRAKATSEEQMLQLGQMNAFLLDRLRGLSTLRALQAVDLTGQRLHDHAQGLRQRTMRVLRIAFLSSAVLEFFSALGVAMVAVYIGFHLLGNLSFGAWGGKLELGQAMWVLLLAPAFFDPLRELSAVWHDKASGEAALQTLQSMQRQSVQWVGADQLQAAAQPQGPSDATAALSAALPAALPAASLQIRDLRVQAPGSPSGLGLVSLDIPPGEHVALWSPSGSGKSLLLAQIAALLPVQQGEIRVDGERLDAHSAGRLRARMAWMSQQPHVFAGSVQRNVGLGREDASAQRIAAATTQAALEQTLAARAAMSLGEGGAGLSGGEVVRLALARLAVQTSDSVGLLLVDEPTAHLDPACALEVIEALKRLARGRTLLVATHDAQLAAAMDRVIELPCQDSAAKEQS